MKLRQLLADLVPRFAQAGIADAQTEAEILVSEIIDISRGELNSKLILDASVSLAELERVRIAADRRQNREPLQHITGKAYFRSLVLRVGQGVFIPRPETETLVQFALEEIQTRENPVVVDLGTGSGAIAIALAVESDAKVFAIDASSQALEYASSNATAHNAKVEFIAADFSELQSLFNFQFDLVISNPPYIPLDAIPTDAEVFEYDPELALYSGMDGLDAIREISIQAGMVLKPGGVLLIEHAQGQRKAILELLLGDGWKSPEGFEDYNQRQRYIKATR